MRRPQSRQDVGRKELNEIVRTLALLLLVSLAGGDKACAGTLLAVEADSAAVLPLYLNEVATGAPADSLVLRVSLYSSPGDGRFDAQAYVVVEEIRWPFPPPRVRIDAGEGVQSDSAPWGEGEAIMAVSRISWKDLNQARRDSLPDAPVPGARPGEIGGHWARPYRFVAWVTPRRFVIDDGRARFEIERVGGGEFAIARVSRAE